MAAGSVRRELPGHHPWQLPLRQAQLRNEHYSRVRYFGNYGMLKVLEYLAIVSKMGMGKWE